MRFIESAVITLRVVSPVSSVPRGPARLSQATERNDAMPNLPIVCEVCLTRKAVPAKIVCHLCLASKNRYVSIGFSGLAKSHKAPQPKTLTEASAIELGGRAA